MQPAPREFSCHGETQPSLLPLLVVVMRVASQLAAREPQIRPLQTPGSDEASPKPGRHTVARHILSHSSSAGKLGLFARALVSSTARKSPSTGRVL